MPDSSGRFKGVSVPKVPWHRETYEPIRVTEEESRRRIRQAILDAGGLSEAEPPEERSDAGRSDSA